MRRLLGYTSSLVLAAVVLSAALPAAEAQAVPPERQPSVKVKVQHGQAQIGDDGSVSLTIRARCDEGLNAFEIDAGVRQDGAFGSVTLLQSNVTPCDNRWHAINVIVQPESGTFSPGRANVSVFLAAFDPVEGDLAAEDSATIRLR